MEPGSEPTCEDCRRGFRSPANKDCSLAWRTVLATMASWPAHRFVWPHPGSNRPAVALVTGIRRDSAESD